MWEALQFVEELRAGRPTEKAVVRKAVQDEASMNDRAIAELEAMLRGASK